MGRFDALTTLDTKPAQPAPLSEKPTVIQPTNLPANQFASKLANQQSSKEANQQVSEPVSLQTNKEASKQAALPTNQFTSKEVNQQISKETNQQTTKEKKKYGTYLREDSITAIQMLAVQTKQKDHVILQEIVDHYFTNKK
jgi:hypothetical protein